MIDEYLEAILLAPLLLWPVWWLWRRCMPEIVTNPGTPMQAVQPVPSNAIPAEPWGIGLLASETWVRATLGSIASGVAAAGLIYGMVTGKVPIDLDSLSVAIATVAGSAYSAWAAIARVNGGKALSPIVVGGPK